MKKILLVIITSIFILACNSSRDIPVTPQMDFSYLALGDSYTIGEGVGVAQSWPVQLVERLKERGHKMAAPKIVARTGWTTRNLITNFESEIDVHRDFHLVSILIGVNNQYQKRTLSEFEVELREIFRKAITHSKLQEKGVFALSIPDYGVTPFGANNADTIAVQIARFNDVVQRVAQDNNVDFYNITPISQEAAVNRNLIAGDSLHPSALMYSRWVDEIIDRVEEKLR
ncbi:SGNH/GDSL hydrolase family protein [Antarcticibacterium arcticum]|uniref:SGNH/GDSL hydrolase family protein n=1 Tax=Antarcticibacterium arcticum TaxID=2585771 RepID=A0A5B8YIR6_9FLAO|nr:SGNH/GDSL hydrolase family protein [Antarcticibacterium arcticum]QED37674.1 SGNH/GDSL hydrolase family protein [Antarcticibacterium arcticum]